MNILSFGEIIWDVYPDRRVIGGAPLNFAGHCAMGGQQAFLLSAVGKDDLGKDAREKLAAFGIRDDLVLENDRATGQCLVTLDEKGIPSYRVLTDTAYDNIAPADTARLRDLHIDAFYFGTLVQRSACSRQTLEQILAECSFGEVFCDLNLRTDCYDEQSVQNCLSHATVLKFSSEEAPLLEEYAFWRALCAGGLFDALFAAYKQLRVILFTKGGNGSEIYTRDGAHHTVSAVGNTVVSTVGAGDSFGASWLCRYLSGDDEKRAAEIASRVSGYVVSCVDALPKYDISDFV